MNEMNRKGMDGRDCYGLELTQKEREIQYIAEKEREISFTAEVIIGLCNVRFGFGFGFGLGLW